MSDDRYPVLLGESRREETIDRSRFITTVASVATAEDAMRFVSRIRVEFPDATHHCYAYQVGPPGTTSSVGMSDDGEPHGTAGRPMLNMLIHSGVGDVVAVVTRYYGGRKLGRGGLGRAYGGGVQAALAEAPRGMRVEWVSLELSFPYADTKSVRRLYPAHEVEPLAERFDVCVTDQVRLPESREAGFLAELTDLLRGTGTVCRIASESS